MTTNSILGAPKVPHRALAEKSAAAVSQPTNECVFVSFPHSPAVAPTLQQVGSFALKALKNVKRPDGLVRS